MTVVLDAGAFVAVERGDRDFVALIERERLAGRTSLSHGGVVAQVWRGDAGREAELARLLRGVDGEPLGEGLGKRAGIRIARAGATTDAIDAAVVCLAADGDDVFTSDPDDLAALADAAGVHVEIVAV